MKILKRYVGECPRCHSPLTGRLAQGPDGKAEFYFGSPVIYCRDLSGYNCACPVCGNRWFGVSSYKMTDIKKIKAMKRLWNEEVGTFSPLTRDEENEILNDLSVEAGLSPGSTRQTRKRSWFSKYVAGSFANDARTIVEPLTDIGVLPDRKTRHNTEDSGKETK